LLTLFIGNSLRRVKEGVIIRDHDKNNERGGLPETSKVWVSNWFLYGSSINC